MTSRAARQKRTAQFCTPATIRVRAASCTLNVAGSRLSKTICHDLNVPYINCGSLVLAFSDADLITLESLLERGRQNGVEGLEILPPERLFELEPKLSRHVKGALLAPTAAIVNPWEFPAVAENAVENRTTLP